MSKLQKMKDVIIYKDTNFNSFPNIIKQPNGELMVAFRQAPDWQQRYGKVTHCDPASKAVYVSSDDGGQTWSSSVHTLYDDFYLGIQDPCTTLLKDGTIFCTYFTWKIFEASDVPNPIPNESKVFGRWYRRNGGVYSIRSSDAGQTWEEYAALASSTDCLFQEPNLFRTNAGEVILRDDGLGFDIGYTSAVQLDDGNILVTYYYYDEEQGHRYIAGSWCNEVL